MNKVMIGLLCGLAVSAGFAEYGAPYARDGKISLTATNGMYRVVHTGKQDWALTLKGGSVAVKPGEIYRLACRSAAVPGAPVKQKAHVSVVLTGEKGKVLRWGFGAKDFFAGEACESVFTIPLGATGIQARVGGTGPYTGDVGDELLEKAGCVPLAANLPERWTLESDALAVDVRTDNLGLSVTDKRTGRTWASTASAGDFPAYLVRAARRPAAGELEIDVTDALTRGERTVRFALDPSAPAEFTASVSGDGALKRTFAYPDAFASRTGDFLVVPVSEGFLLPLGTNTLSIGDLSAHSASMSMPFFGISEGAEGAGWMTILETPDDAKMTAYRAKGVLAGAAPGWAPTRGQFGYTRRALRVSDVGRLRRDGETLPCVRGGERSRENVPRKGEGASAHRPSVGRGERVVFRRLEGTRRRRHGEGIESGRARPFPVEFGRRRGDRCRARGDAGRARGTLRLLPRRLLSRTDGGDRDEAESRQRNLPQHVRLARRHHLEIGRSERLGQGLGRTRQGRQNASLRHAVYAQTARARTPERRARAADDSVQHAVHRRDHGVRLG